ncbi:MAG: VOC family protein [Propionibacteriaceae bacterium]|nr:VOC family protein [Propionibacteriaceae bacterium]
MSEELLRKVDAVTIRVPTLDEGLCFYRDQLGHALLWRNDAVGQLGLSVPDSDTELVLTTEQSYEPNWLVSSADEAAVRVRQAGGEVLSEPVDIAVGRLAVVADPFGNKLVLVDLSKGRYQTGEDGTVLSASTQSPGSPPSGGAASSGLAPGPSAESTRQRRAPS